MQGSTIFVRSGNLVLGVLILTERNPNSGLEGEGVVVVVVVSLA